MNDSNHIEFKYIFNLKGGEVIEHLVKISNNNLVSQVDLPKNIPDWANLNSNKCANCSLKETDYCPVAVRLIKPINKFHKLRSHMKAHVFVESGDRIYSKDTDVQDGLRSLFGLIMATSGCPSMNEFKPMAFYHLPFSSVSETVYRVISMYLVKRFAEYRDSDSMPINVNDIEYIYDRIEEVNAGIRSRLIQCVENDSTLNAITILDSLATLVPFKLEKTLYDLGWE